MLGSVKTFSRYHIDITKSAFLIVQCIHFCLVLQLCILPCLEVFFRISEGISPSVTISDTKIRHPDFKTSECPYNPLICLV